LKAFIIILVITLLLTIVIPASAIILYFSDGFESGNFTAWDDWDDDGGDLSVAVGAALHGSYGMSIFIQDTDGKGVNDTTPIAETRHRCRFYIDPNGLSMGEGDTFQLLYLSDSGFNEAYHLNLKYTAANGYQILAVDRTDDAWDKDTGWWTITNDVHCIEIDWQASSGVGNNDGRLQLWIDGVSKIEVTDIDSDTETIDLLWWGAPFELDATTSGTFYLDDFASNDDGSPIGQMQDVSKECLDLWNLTDLVKLYTC
jgi:hypothetical protein